VLRVCAACVCTRVCACVRACVYAGRKSYNIVAGFSMNFLNAFM